jgi:hypothetical protein
MMLGHGEGYVKARMPASPRRIEVTRDGWREIAAFKTVVGRGSF